MAYFKRLLSSVIDLPADRIDAEASLEDYGVDSVMTMEMTRALEEVFGSLPKTLFFEHRTISALTRHLLQTHPQQIGELVPAAGGRRQPPAVGPDAPEQPVPGAGRTWPVPSAAPAARPAGPATASPDVAIIGLAGRYPQAPDLATFWENLLAGKNSVTEVPADRWDYQAYYYDEDKTKSGRVYCRWGGFLDDVTRFDPLFFNISPREAAMMDPQERLFLECAYEVVQDAGYVPDDLDGSAGRAGVFVGMMYRGLPALRRPERQKDGVPVAVPGNFATVANRISFHLNFHGPSMAVDTMCSSSLTAISLACEALRRGNCDVAIAGGVNLSLHPNKYLVLSPGKVRLQQRPLRVLRRRRATATYQARASAPCCSSHSTGPCATATTSTVSSRAPRSTTAAAPTATACPTPTRRGGGQQGAAAGRRRRAGPSATSRHTAPAPSWATRSRFAGFARRSSRQATEVSARSVQ